LPGPIVVRDVGLHRFDVKPVQAAVILPEEFSLRLLGQRREAVAVNEFLRISKSRNGSSTVW
jgi:hypothetical protein